MIKLPKNHRIIQYFPFLENEDKLFSDYKNEFLYKIETIKPQLDFFYNIKFDDMLNHRYPITTAFFIKDDLINKTLVHIGSKKQELDVGFMRYCNKIYGIELDKRVKIRDDLYNLNYELILDDYKNVIEKINGDVYYFWTGYNIDINILNDLIVNYKKKGIFYLGVPQQDDKLCIFLELLQSWYNKNKYVKIDYISILFDESNNIVKHRTQFTEDNKNEEWNQWKTFNNMKAILFLIKISL